MPGVVIEPENKDMLGLITFKKRYVSDESANLDLLRFLDHERSAQHINDVRKRFHFCGSVRVLCWCARSRRCAEGSAI